MRSVRLYTRRECGLCQEMVDQLAECQGETAFNLELIDVDTDSKTRDEYGSYVPLLETPDGSCLSKYFLDKDKLLRYLEGG